MNWFNRLADNFGICSANGIIAGATGYVALRFFNELNTFSLSENQQNDLGIGLGACAIVLAFNAAGAVATAQDSKTATIIGGTLGTAAGMATALTLDLITEEAFSPKTTNNSSYNITVEEPEYPALEKVVFDTSPQAALG